MIDVGDLISHMSVSLNTSGNCKNVIRHNNCTNETPNSPPDIQLKAITRPTYVTF